MVKSLPRMFGYKPKTCRKPVHIDQMTRNVKKEIPMKKGRLFKGLVLAMAMVMLLSVTAFAGTSVSWNAKGISASGSVGYTSGSTSASDYTSIYVEVAFTYINSRNQAVTVYDSTSNAAKVVHASVSVPSDFVGHNVTNGTHTVNGSTNYTEYR